MPSLKERYTIHDLAQVAALPENHGKLLELIDGEIIEKMGSFIPSTLAMKLGAYLLAYLAQNPIGYITGADGTYILSESNKPMPDVGYISKARLTALPQREVPIPPDLAVEVVSPNDALQEVRRKVYMYLEHGVQEVWVVYPEDQTLDVYTPTPEGASIRHLKQADTLTGGVLLPGFTLPLSQLFELYES
jgi:Uma2 family endonuclease